MFGLSTDTSLIPILLSTCCWPLSRAGFQSRCMLGGTQLDSYSAMALPDLTNYSEKLTFVLIPTLTARSANSYPQKPTSRAETQGNENEDKNWLKTSELVVLPIVGIVVTISPSFSL